jgi:integrase
MTDSVLALPYRSVPSVGSAGTSSSTASVILPRDGRCRAHGVPRLLGRPGDVAASTLNQALSALRFLYRDVLEQDVPWLDEVVRAKRPERLPVALTRGEVRSVMGSLTSVPRLMALLLYGAGLRLLECAHLSVKDLDFARNQIGERGNKADKDRMTMLPAPARDASARRRSRQPDGPGAPGAPRRDH